MSQERDRSLAQAIYHWYYAKPREVGIQSIMFPYTAVIWAVLQPGGWIHAGCSVTKPRICFNWTAQCASFLSNVFAGVCPLVRTDACGFLMRWRARDISPQPIIPVGAVPNEIMMIESMLSFPLEIPTRPYFCTVENIIVSWTYKFIHVVRGFKSHT